MTHQEKMEFLSNLDSDGFDVVCQKLRKGIYGSEYERLANDWAKKRETFVPFRSHKIRFWRLIVAIVAVSITIVVIILNLLSNGE